MKIIKTSSEKETFDEGYKLGKSFKKNDVVLLNGDLGAGKTVFTKGMANALGIDEPITSPTFTIVNEYHSGDNTLYHFDVYRILDIDEMFEIGFDEYFYKDGIIVIEWSDLIKDILPKEYIYVKINRGESIWSDDRVIAIEFVGDRYKDIREEY